MQGPGGPSRASPGVPVARRRLVTAGRLEGFGHRSAGRVPGPYHGGSSQREAKRRPPGRLRSKPIKHRARDALGLADLRHALPIARTRAKGEAQGLRQASMSRGVEARGSSWTPGVPRALGWGGRQKDQEDGPARGLDKEYGRWRLRGEMPRKAVSGITASHARERQALPHNLARGRWQNGPDNRPDTAAAPVRDR